MNIHSEPEPQDDTISRRLDEIERALKFDPDASYRRELIREYLAYTTDPEEPKPGVVK